jgi:hypothetical protein
MRAEPCLGEEDLSFTDDLPNVAMNPYSMSGMSEHGSHSSIPARKFLSEQ